MSYNILYHPRTNSTSSLQPEHIDITDHVLNSDPGKKSIMIWILTVLKL